MAVAVTVNGGGPVRPARCKHTHKADKFATPMGKEAWRRGGGAQVPTCEALSMQGSLCAGGHVRAALQFIECLLPGMHTNAKQDAEQDQRRTHVVKSRGHV